MHERSEHNGDGPCAACYPLCAGCDCVIVAAVGDAWRVRVKDPIGREMAWQAFCLPCMVELAKVGLKLGGR